MGLFKSERNDHDVYLPDYAHKEGQYQTFLEKQQSKICYGEKRKSKGKEKCKRKESEDHRNGNGWKRKEEICND